MRMFLCVYLPNIGQAGMELRGWRGFWEHVITPKGGEGSERSLLYKHASNISSGGHPIAFYCDEFNIMMRRSR